ncbi:DNA ligase 6-like isoform X2 [Prosopis cineraria]|uniref:DNA ligase 6-like isoform X2 n=1 Tax=Prosopis cineraria TaxID=364024 RepID=UPI00240EBF25|nr:DNA ligase 6-like isoform X2 [Prosopis cineraria]
MHKSQTLSSVELFHSALQSPDSSPPSTSVSLQPHHSPLPSSFPQSKLIPKTRFLVDAFRHAGDYSVAYFLSHFHSDHYTGLGPNWSKGIVYCSNTTARLVVEVLGVPSKFVVPLRLCEPVDIDGCEVTLVDANHCPGAVQFLFKIPGVDGKCERYVHTGDFRFSKAMKLEPLLAPYIGADAVFLDTTYCHPKFQFPSQEESVAYVVDVVGRTEGENDCSTRNVLFLVATYVVGKEKILLELARRFKRKVHVDARKMEVLRVLGYGEGGEFTDDDSQTNIHVVGWNVLGETWPYFRPNFVRMMEIMTERGYSKVVGFVPTGWTCEVKRNKFTVKSKDSFQIHLVPYSEHSNYDELREYVKFLKPKRVVPTVGVDVDKTNSKHVEKMMKHFAGLVDETANKQKFLKGFYCASSEGGFKFDEDDNGVMKPGQNMETEEKLFGKEGDKSFNPDIVLNLSSTLEESDLRDPPSLKDEETEKISQEMSCYLPAWVTQGQVLELISNARGNVVEAVSDFYERETDFHDQVFSCQTSDSVSSSKCLSNDNDLLSKPPVVSSKTCMNVDILPSQDFKLSTLRHTVASNISPAKRKRNSERKLTKKVRVNAKSESSGPKQSSITKFFTKILPDIIQSEDFEGSYQSPKAEDFPQLDVEKAYKDEIDHFMQIINCNESLKEYAIAIIEKTKGDVNKALDIYYCNPGNFADNENSVQVECKVDNSSEKKCVSREVGSTPDISVQSVSMENVDATLVSLPLKAYNPKEHACWRDGEFAPYLHLARTFNLLEDEKGKIKATSMLCNMFRSLLALSPADVLPAVYLCTNKIAADHENKELSIGGSLITAALEEACGTTRMKIKEMYNKFGDVAQECRQTQRLLAPPTPLLIKDVFFALHKISLQTGNGSTLRKKSIIVNLMCSCREKEIKFLVRTLVRNLRIGAMIRTVLPALAQAVVMNSCPTLHQDGTAESLKEKLQGISAEIVEAYNILPNLDVLIPSLMNKGPSFCASSLSMVPGIPIKPMLARITNGIPQVLKLFQNKAFTCEYKYDGQRAQIHKLSDGSIRVFSRNGDETTSRFPDLIDIIKEFCKPVSVTFILDAEIVGIDRKNGYRYMAFQELSSRGRGSKDASVTAESIKVDICLFVFDIMFANGQQLLGFPLRERRKYLKDLFHGEKLGYFEYAKETTIEADDASLTCEATVSRINSFLEDAIHSSCEGIMVKSLDVDAGYTPSKRTDTWLKVKRDYVDGLNDSLDLVPIGGWYGNGRKAGWYSPFLMACYNPETEEYQSVCRVMSGFSDSFYIEMKEFFSDDKILSKKPPYYRTAEMPDKWFSPLLVWEIRGAEFTVSPVHHAAIGLVHPSRGISIRFPRFVRSVSDRNPEECSTASEIAELFHSQTRKMDVAADD